MFLNLIGNLSQLSITLFFGLIGFVFLIRNFSFQIPKANPLKFLLIQLFFVVLFLFIKRISVYKIKDYLK